MVNYLETLDATFSALADPTRRAILARLALGEEPVSALAGPLPMSLPALLKHVTALERAGLVKTRKEGRERRCRLQAVPLREAATWIDGYRAFWERRFAALDRYLTETEHEEKAPWRSRNSPPPSRSGPGAPSRRRAKGSSARGPRPKR